MGANRQSRFHGKDPRYKNKDRARIVDCSPVQTNHDEVAELNRKSLDAKMRWHPARTLDRIKIAPEPELEEVVKRYLAQKANADTEPSALERHNAEIVHAPERVMLDAPIGANDSRQLAPRKHDILLQLFSERKISLGHFHAGRRWQWDREASTIQPVVTIDWSMSSPNPYQLDGEMTERQWEAMRRRKQFVAFAGLAAATMLDFMLEVDRGRADLIELTKMPAVQIECAIEELLEKVCECFA